MVEEISKLNQQYIDNAIDVFPFLSKYRITVLKAGFYTQMNAPFMGIRYVNDRQKHCYRTLLIGFHYVPKDLIIVPPTVELTEGKQNLIDKYLEQGYELITRFPSLHAYEFAEDSVEYIAAKKSYRQYRRAKKAQDV